MTVWEYSGLQPVPQPFDPRAWLVAPTGSEHYLVAVDVPSAETAAKAKAYAAANTPILQAGETQSVPYLLSLKESRFGHKPLGWREVKLTRTGDVQTLIVPAGVFEVEVLTAAVQGGPTRTYYVETAEPHRIVKWESTDGEKAEMLKSVRSKYWEMNGPAGVDRLRELDLMPRPPRTM